MTAQDRPIPQYYDYDEGKLVPVIDRIFATLGVQEFLEKNIADPNGRTQAQAEAKQAIADALITLQRDDVNLTTQQQQTEWLGWQSDRGNVPQLCDGFNLGNDFKADLVGLDHRAITTVE